MKNVVGKRGRASKLTWGGRRESSHIFVMALTEVNRRHRLLRTVNPIELHSSLVSTSQRYLYISFVAHSFHAY